MVDDIIRLHQRVVRRNRVFVFLPSVILALLLAVLTFELVRSNVSPESRDIWPWRISILGVAPSASLAGVFVGLLLARGQFARSVRPVVGWSGAWTTSSTVEAGGRNLQSQRWEVNVYNGGSGLGVIQSTFFRVVGTAQQPATDSWVRQDQVNEHLRKVGLKQGSDYVLIELGVGHPLVASTKPMDGFKIFSIQEHALPRLIAFDMRIVIVDIVGDVHERYIELLKGAVDELVPGEPPSAKRNGAAGKAKG